MSGSILESINKLNALYAASLDEDQLEEWPGFFVDDCFYKITTCENYEQGRPAGLVYADSKSMLVDRISSLREANIYERQRYRHLIGMPLIQAETSETVVASTSFMVCRTMRGGAMSVFAAGKYLDELVKVGADLKINKRIVVCDSVAVNTLLAIPL